VLVALLVVGFELIALAWLRFRFFGTSFLASFAYVTFGGAVIVGVSVALGTSGRDLDSSSTAPERFPYVFGVTAPSGRTLSCRVEHQLQGGTTCTPSECGAHSWP
jgi:hypothetical protein